MDLSDFLNKIKKYKAFTLRGLLYYISLKLRGRQSALRGACTQCGECCRSICLEDSHGWIHSEERFQKIVKDFPEYERFEVCGKDEDGHLLFTCTWHTSGGVCKNYQERLDICRKYPDKSLVFCGGYLPGNCGYSFIETTDFKKLLIKKMRQIK